jgi:hypothetical protein
MMVTEGREKEREGEQSQEGSESKGEGEAWTVGKWAGEQMDGGGSRERPCTAATGASRLNISGLKVRRGTAYLSGSESSVSRLLVTLLARPSDS